MNNPYTLSPDFSGYKVIEKKVTDYKASKENQTHNLDPFQHLKTACLKINSAYRLKSIGPFSFFATQRLKLHMPEGYKLMRQSPSYYTH